MGTGTGYMAVLTSGLCVSLCMLYISTFICESVYVWIKSLSTIYTVSILIQGVFIHGLNLSVAVLLSPLHAGITALPSLVFSLVLTEHQIYPLETIRSYNYSAQSSSITLHSTEGDKLSTPMFCKATSLS